MSTGSPQQRVQTAIDRLVDAGDEVGLQVAVVAGGEVVVDAASGPARPGRDVASDTLFHAASTAKGVASTVAHVLVERGDLVGARHPLRLPRPDLRLPPGRDRAPGHRPDAVVVAPGAAYANRPDVVTAEIPSAGTMTARGVARMYSALLGNVDGVDLVSPARLTDLAAVHYEGYDHVMDVPSQWAFGYSSFRPARSTASSPPPWRPFVRVTRPVRAVRPAGVRPMSPTARDAIVGDVVVPGDDAYDGARQVYNALHDTRPALVVRPRTPTDVAQALAVAREEGLEVAVKGGGHSIAGYGTTDGGLLIDLTAMNAIHVDRAQRRAVVGGGVRAGALTNETYGHGLIVPFGDNPDVGVSGITLGGGIGWLSRKLGLTLDSLEGAEVVLADGQVVTADDDQHPDLFWALRGGGGNFGVVTRMRFRLHPLGPVLGGVLALPATPDVVRGALALADAAPDDLGTISLVTRLPPLPFVPEDAHGRPAVMITLVWAGEPAEGRRRIDDLRRLAPPLVDEVVLRPYPEMYDLFADVPPSVTNATTTLLADEVGDLDMGSDGDGVQAILDAVEQPPEPDAPVLSAVELRVLGGAVARLPDDATAFGHRRRKLGAAIVAAGFEPDRTDVHRAWITALADRLAPMSKGAYLNFVDTANEHRIDDVYPPGTRRRLAEVKARYDPDNVFRRNLNITPTP